MASIRVEFDVEAPADRVWAAVRDFATPHLLAPGFVVSTSVDGDTRDVTFFNGRTATELLVNRDDEARRLVWSVVAGPLGCTHHNSSAEVGPLAAGRSRFVWITDVLPHHLGEPIGEMMRLGSEAIARRFAATSAAT
jgi:hypothetical protein